MVFVTNAQIRKTLFFGQIFFATSYKKKDTLKFFIFFAETHDIL